MFRYWILVSLLGSGVTYGGQRTEKIEALIKAQGLLDSWQQEMSYGKAEGRKQAKTKPKGSDSIEIRPLTLLTSFSRDNAENKRDRPSFSSHQRAAHG